MKRFLPVLGIAALFVGFTALVQTFYFGAHAVPKWQALPGGGEIAFHQVTFGTDHEVDHPQPALSERFGDAARLRSLEPLFQKPGRSGFRSSGEPSLGVWFAFRQTLNAPQLQDLELILPDGQIYYSRSSGMSGGGFQRGLSRIQFNVAPYTVEKFLVTATIDGKRCQWEIPNPTYAPTPQTATAEPLPQMRRVGDYEVTLHELKLTSGTSRQTNWMTKPVFTVSLNGEDVTERFAISSMMSDRGLLSAPVWRIDADVSRTSSYPFAADEIEWLGTVAKAEADALKPEQYVLIPVTEVARSRGITLAVVLGPGQYELSEQAVLKAAPLSAVQTKKNRSIDFDWKTKKLQVTLKKSSTLVISNYAGEGIMVFRTLADKQVRPYPASSFSWGPQLEIYDALEEAVRFGVADRRAPFTAGKPIQFLVRPPAIPKQ